jgi:hypothetical protein
MGKSLKKIILKTRSKTKYHKYDIQSGNIIIVHFRFYPITKGNFFFLSLRIIMSPDCSCSFDCVDYTDLII